MIEHKATKRNKHVIREIYKIFEIKNIVYYLDKYRGECEYRLIFETLGMDSNNLDITINLENYEVIRIESNCDFTLVRKVIELEKNLKKGLTK